MQGRSIGQWLEIGGSKEADGAKVLDVWCPATNVVETAPTMGTEGVGCTRGSSLSMPTCYFGAWNHDNRLWRQI